jgi:aryl-alcohol dehydrogenase-like predicted oxidoreductase
MKRRVFLKVVGGAAGGYVLSPMPILSGEKPPTTEPIEKVAGLPRRVLGRTGQKVSIVGFPGLALIHYDQDRGTAALHDAFERGVNYFDVAPAYGNGQCETRMGIGLQGLDRSRMFLACKTKKRDKEGARQELEQSLKLLKTDHFDLYQMHHLVTPQEVKQALGPGGALETFLRAKEEGKVKYLGFSAHTTKGALEALKAFRFDTAMFPINFVEYLNRGFGKDVLDAANQRGTAVLAIKPLSWGAWPEGMQRTRDWWYRTVDDRKEVELAMRFTLSQTGVVAGIPPSFLDLLDKAIEAAKAYRPLDPAGTEQLRKMAANCGSIFLREEQQVALNLPGSIRVHPDSPHEGCGGHCA